MIGRLYEVVIDCPDPRALGAFYAELTGLDVNRVYADPAGHPFCLCRQDPDAP